MEQLQAPGLWGTSPFLAHLDPVATAGGEGGAPVPACPGTPGVPEPGQAVVGTARPHTEPCVSDRALLPSGSPSTGLSPVAARSLLRPGGPGGFYTT